MHTQPLSLFLPPPNGFDGDCRALAALCAVAVCLFALGGCVV